MKTKNLVLPAAVALVIAAGSEGVLAQVGTEGAPAGTGGDPAMLKYGGQYAPATGSIAGATTPAPAPATTMDTAAQQAIYDGLYDFYYYTVPIEYVQSVNRAYGTLNGGQTGSMQSGLLAGAQYMIGAQCEPDDCQDIYLHIYDPSGNLVVEDATGTNFAYVNFQAAESGNYTVGVTVANCSADPCHFGVDIFSKTTP